MSGPTSTPEATPVEAPAIPEGSPLAVAAAPPAPAAEAAPDVKSGGEIFFPDQAKADAEAAKPEGEAAPVEAKAEAEEPKVEEKPAETEYKFTLPDDIKVDPKALTGFTEFATKANLSQEDAQAMLDLHVGQVKATAEALSTAISAQWKTTIDGWKEEIEKDPDLGGANREKALATIGRALDDYGSPEARQAFDSTGAGWNPAIVRMIYKMSSALTEGGPVQAGVLNARKNGTVAQRFYPSAEPSTVQ